MIFVCNAQATTEIYTYGHSLSLHDSLPICKKAAPAIRRAADLAAPRIGIRRIIGHQRSDSIGIIWRKGIVSEAISLCQIAEHVSSGIEGTEGLGLAA